MPMTPHFHRNHLPHFDGADYQMITYRLADALPAEVWQRLQDYPDKARRERIEELMDAGYGACWLANDAVAGLVLDNWRHFDPLRYQLIAWVIMPNHVHLVIRLTTGESLARIVHSWKSYTGKRIDALMNLPNEQHAIWQADYWDRYIRSEQHYLAAINYIHNNPVKAGLVNTPQDWCWSSASDHL